MAAPAHAAEVKPLPKAAAKGGAEPRASHPDKAPQAPGWVSMASGVDGASTLVSSPQIGEGFFTFCLWGSKPKPSKFLKPLNFRCLASVTAISRASRAMCNRRAPVSWHVIAPFWPSDHIAAKSAKSERGG